MLRRVELRIIGAGGACVGEGMLLSCLELQAWCFGEFDEKGGVGYEFAFSCPSRNW